MAYICAESFTWAICPGCLELCVTSALHAGCYRHAKIDCSCDSLSCGEALVEAEADLTGLGSS